MSREIKFRGYDEENKCWRYGWYTKLAEGIRRIDAIISDIDGELTRFYIHDEKTINQFTGLKDKNGKEIYESDIVRIWADPEHYSGYTGHDYVEAVVWNPQEARFELTEHGFYDFEFIQVIGNIYENKELLG